MGPSTLIDGDPLCPQTHRRGSPLQWGRRLSSTETDEPELVPTPMLGASMGPSTLIDGDVGARAPVLEQLDGFNGAVDSHRRRLGNVITLSDPTDVLQWGRRLSSTETHTTGSREHRAGCFNGAVDSHRRRPHVFNPTTVGPDRLQWGRRLSSTETRPSRSMMVWTSSLQWGRRLSSTETSRAPATSCQ